MAIAFATFKTDVFNSLKTNINVGIPALSIKAEFPNSDPVYPILILPLVDNSYERVGEMASGMRKVSCTVLMQYYERTNLATSDGASSVMSTLEDQRSDLRSEGIVNLKFASSPTNTIFINNQNVHVCTMALTFDVFFAV